MRWIIVLSVMILGTACSHTAATNQKNTYAQASCNQAIEPDMAVRMDVVKKLMENGRLHAALAHMDDLKQSTPQAHYLRAEILRQSNRGVEAKPIYQSLVGTCLEGEAYHGLGLIAGREGQFYAASCYLSEASRQRPLTARIRNDYGYALLLMGHYELAQREFFTAIELDQDKHLAESNLIILFYLEGSTQKAHHFAQQINMDSTRLDALQRQARSLAESKF